MVGKDDLMNAVALNSALFNATRVLGPALAGVLVAKVGVAICFVLNAASYAPIIVGLAMMRTIGAPLTESGSHLDRVRQGLAYVRATPAILLPIALVGSIGVFGMNFNVWVPLLAERDFASGASGFGLLLAAMGTGSLAGALTLAFAGRRPDRRRMLTAAAIFGGLEIGLALAGAASIPLLLVLPLMAAIGFTVSTAMALANTTVQTTAPDALRGRVMSVYMTVFAGTAPLGAVLAGVTARFLGTPASVAIGGCAVLIATSGIAVWTISQHRPADEPESTPAAVRPKAGD
jgi:predicted MFS family arabinose efflux permease